LQARAQDFSSVSQEPAWSRKHTGWIRRGRSAGEAGSCAPTGSNFSATHQDVAEQPLKAQSLVVGLVDFNESGFDLHLRRCDIQRLDGFFNDVQVGHRGAHKQDAGSVIEEERLLVPSGTRLSLAAQASQATAAKTAPSATADATGLAWNKRGREVNARRLEKLPDEDLDIAHDVLPGHSGQTEASLPRTAATLAATTLATTYATTTTLATALAALLAAHGRGFNPRDCGNGRTSATALATTLAATATTATATATALAALACEISNDESPDRLQTLEERVGVNAELTGVQLLRLRQPLGKDDGVVFD
jgi:hypothetical protein